MVRWGIVPGFWADGIIRSGEVHDLTERRTSYHLNVLSTLLPPPQAELADPEEKP